MNYELRDWGGGMFESSVEAQCFVTQTNNVTQILCVCVRIRRDVALQRLIKTANEFEMNEYSNIIEKCSVGAKLSVVKDITL